MKIDSSHATKVDIFVTSAKSEKSFTVNSRIYPMTGQNMGLTISIFCSIIPFYSPIKKKYKFFFVIFFTIQKLAISLHREKRGLCKPSKHLYRQLAVTVVSNGEKSGGKYIP